MAALAAIPSIMSAQLPAPQPPVTLAAIRFAAMNYLAMREYSQGELKKKLDAKYTESGLVRQVIAQLVEQGLQSDLRFTEAFIRMRQRQGKGPVLIKLELRAKMIANHLIEACLDESDSVWSQLAQQVRRKRFGNNPKHDANKGDSAVKERIKQKRFLLARGFTIQHIQAAFQQASGEGDE